MSRIFLDTSVWIDHLRSTDEQLVTLLNQYRVLMHPMVLGELACGCLHNRTQLLTLLKNLPGINIASHEEALFCLDRHNLMGKRIGFIDLHLLAATFLGSGTLLWTRDKRLHKLACALNIAFNATTS